MPGTEEILVALIILLYPVSLCLVVEIDVQDQMVLLEDGEAPPFSHLILATGSTGLFPGKFNQVSSQELAI